MYAYLHRVALSSRNFAFRIEEKKCVNIYALEIISYEQTKPIFINLFI